MIVAEQKPLDEIHRMLAGRERVLAVGCGTCVTVCLAGGAKEVATLATALRMKSRVEGSPIDVDEELVQRQCEHEYLEQLDGAVEGHDALLSLGCGIGVQTLAERYPDLPVLPALDTAFMGLPTEHGVWEERCQACGRCILDLTGGICPVSRCAKQLLNGPCGGSQDGHCEIDPKTPCAWALIWERAERLGTVERLMEVQPPRDWSRSRDGGPRRIVREDLRLPVDPTSGSEEG